MNKQVDFDSLSNREQRIAILKDVELNIKKNINYHFGKGYTFYNSSTSRILWDSGKHILASIKSEDCQVCVRGALFLSKVKLNGDVITNLSCIHSMVTGENDYFLNNTFSYKELLFIEDFFEVHNYNNSFNHLTDIPFFKDTFNFIERVTMIVKFMLSNDGVMDQEKFLKRIKTYKIYKEALKRQNGG